MVYRGHLLGPVVHSFGPRNAWLARQPKNHKPCLQHLGDTNSSRSPVYLSSGLHKQDKENGNIGPTAHSTMSYDGSVANAVISKKQSVTWFTGNYKEGHP